jgi:hypothetical protein
LRAGRPTPVGRDNYEVCHPELYMAHGATWKRMKICHPERRAVGPKSKDHRRGDSGGASTSSSVTKLVFSPQRRRFSQAQGRLRAAVEGHLR